MATLLLAYSATAYLFSGSVCYLAFNQVKTDSERCQLKSNSHKLASLWIALLWPLWIVKQTNVEDNQPETRVNEIDVREYSNPRRELTSVGSKKER